jgi:flavodoxin
MKNIYNDEFRIIVIYDSIFGNTAKAGKVVAGSISNIPASLKHVSNVDPGELRSFDLVIIGTPGHDGHPTANIMTFIDELPDNCLMYKYIAAFETHSTNGMDKQSPTFASSITPFAANKVLISLMKKGASAIAEPAGFITETRKAPIPQKECKKVAKWAQSILIEKPSGKPAALILSPVC